MWALRAVWGASGRFERRRTRLGDRRLVRCSAYTPYTKRLCAKRSMPAATWGANVSPMVTTLASPIAAAPRANLRDIPRALWLVLLSAFLGWLFDAADVSILTLALAPS